MNGVDFYQVLGVRRSAGADEIRAAFRELVKRHHPDLFSTRADKDQATEKLSRINEAYAVLGNPQRRREYDQTLVQEPKPRPRARTPKRPRKTARSNPRAVPRGRRPRLRFSWARVPKKRLGYALGATAAVLLLVYAFRSEPRWTTGWVLVEKVEVSSATSAGFPQQHGQNWSPVAEFRAVSECTGMLKAKVQEDERRGAKVVFDERNGMMAITIQLERDGGRISNPETTSSADIGAAAPLDGRATITQPTIQRVRNLECRGTRRLETVSWAQRALRRVGLSS